MGAAVHRVSRLRPRVWGALVVLLAAALVGGWMWLRDSSLVSAQHVTVVGATGAEGGEISATLERTAHSMTTLHVDRKRLLHAVAAYPQVKDLKVTAHPLHTLRVEVVERPPVAALAVGDQRTAVAADGTILRGRVSATGLPSVDVSSLPAGGVVPHGDAADALSVLGAAPPALRRLIGSVSEQRGQITAQLRNGPRIMLGTTERPRAKWAAAARVLSDPSSKGAGYIDVRLPERPAAGGFPAGTDAAGETTDSTDEVATATDQLSTSTGG
jgi:cell division protein FtsQ